MAAPVAVRTYAAILAVPAGLHCKLGVCLDQEALCSLDFLPIRHPAVTPASALARRVVDQLQRYFADPAGGFSLPLALHGTPFQQRVWRALMGIPAGSSASYGAVAAQLGTGARAVGNACRSNPVPIIVPCHRVVGQHSLGGYAGDVAGDRPAIKRWLLEHERCTDRAR